MPLAHVRIGSETPGQGNPALEAPTVWRNSSDTPPSGGTVSTAVREFFREFTVHLRLSSSVCGDREEDLQLRVAACRVRAQQEAVAEGLVRRVGASLRVDQAARGEVAHGDGAAGGAPRPRSGRIVPGRELTLR